MTDFVAVATLPALSANVTVIVAKPVFGNVSATLGPEAAGRPGDVHANDAALSPEPPSSAALRVNVAGLPACTVAGPEIVPVGLTVSGRTLAAVVTASLPFVPPIAPLAPSASETARQSWVARAPSASS